MKVEEMACLIDLDCKFGGYCQIDGTGCKYLVTDTNQGLNHFELQTVFTNGNQFLQKFNTVLDVAAAIFDHEYHQKHQSLCSLEVKNLGKNYSIHVYDRYDNKEIYSKTRIKVENLLKEISHVLTITGNLSIERGANHDT